MPLYERTDANVTWPRTSILQRWQAETLADEVMFWLRNKDVKICRSVKIVTRPVMRNICFHFLLFVAATSFTVAAQTPPLVPQTPAIQQAAHQTHGQKPAAEVSKAVAKLPAHPAAVTSAEQRKGKRGKKVPVKAKVVQPEPDPEPPVPLTPEQLPANPPQVSYLNGQLTIQSSNATLNAILNAVRQQTGAQIEVPSGYANQRVATRIGPGPASEVIASLLNGSSFDFVILGKPGAPGAIDRVILTPKSGAPMTPAPAYASAAPRSAQPAAEEDDSAEEEAQPDTAEDQGQPEQPQPPTTAEQPPASPAQPPAGTPQQQGPIIGQPAAGMVQPQGDAATSPSSPSSQPTSQPEAQQQGNSGNSGQGSQIRTPEQMLQDLQRLQQQQQQQQQQK